MSATLSYIPENKFNPLNAELNPICHFLALVGAHHILHVSRVKVKAIFISIRFKFWMFVIHTFIYLLFIEKDESGGVWGTHA